MEFSTKILRNRYFSRVFKNTILHKKEKKIYDTEAARFLVNHATEEKKFWYGKISIFSPNKKKSLKNHTHSTCCSSLEIEKRVSFSFFMKYITSSSSLVV